MHRRRFIGVLGALGLAKAATPEKRTKFYAFEHFTLKNGSGVSRLHDFVTQALLPAMNRVHSGPKVILKQLVGPHTPEVLAIYLWVFVDGRNVGRQRKPINKWRALRECGALPIA